MEGLILQIILVALNIILLVLSGKAARGVTSLKRTVAKFRKSVGEINPDEAFPSTGQTLIQKVENMQSDQQHFRQDIVKSVGDILVTFRREQEQFFIEAEQHLGIPAKKERNVNDKA
jgi:hypothetical protein